MAENEKFDLRTWDPAAPGPPAPASSSSSCSVGQKYPRTALSAVEISIIEKLQRSVTFVPAHRHKSFVHKLKSTSRMSERGRCYLAYIAHRYRRQWQASTEELQWLVQWGAWIGEHK